MNCRIKLLVAVLLISIYSYSQKSKDTAFRIHKYPVKEGYILFLNEQPGRLITYTSGVGIYSKESDVFAFMDGKVVKIFRVDDMDNVLVRKGDTVIVYGNMKIVNKKVGDSVSKTEFLGKLKRDDENDRYELLFDFFVNSRSLIYPYKFDFLYSYYK